MEDIESLKKEIEKLKDSNAVKSDLISISAHQLRTSLSALKWILKMFLDKDLGAMSAEQEGFIKKASDSNDRMIALVNDMLTLSHAEDTALSFKFSPTDVIKLAEQTLFEFSGESQKKQISIIFLKPDHQVPNIQCDPEMIRVVFQNLTENAIKYSEAGDKVVISIKEGEGSLEISVHDNGIGIDKKEQDQIFGKFFRAENAKTKDAIGSGLGLFTIKKIIEHHKGKIWFESTRETGTTFFVSLPTNK
ncbi:HAMP domain-containing histidine kinase [Candidatus Nomurabacteria bacterium]|nr:HAMP domain-containing histidine kinase [Candidatus Nomurabacteria bacterium]